jgi:glycosyltransferase involved in cell wall biosynthesis
VDSQSTEPSKEQRRVLMIAHDWSFLLSYRARVFRALRERGDGVYLAAPGPPPLNRMPPGATAFQLRVERGSSLWREFLPIIDVLRALRATRPHVFEMLSVRAAIYGALGAMLMHPSRVIVWFAGLGLSSPTNVDSKRLLTRVSRFLIRRLPRFKNWIYVAENTADAEFLVGDKRRPRDVRVVRGAGVDLTTFTHSVGTAKRTLILFAGRFLVAKGVRDFVRVVETLKGRQIDVRAVMAGEADLGSPGSVTLDEVEQWRRSGLIAEIGVAPDLAKTFAETAVFCFPSQYGEGAPRVVMEASASGCPVVAYDIPAARGLVEHERTGLLVPAGDWSAMADAVERLLADPAARERMGRAGRALAERSFGAEDALASTLAHYANDHEPSK